MDEPGLGVVVCDDAGLVLDASETGSLLFTGRTREEMVGALIEDLHGIEFAEQIIGNMEVVHRSRKRGIHRMLWGGRQLVVTHHSL